MLLRDIASVEENFEDVEQEASFNGKRAVRINVFRVGEQGPLEIAAAVHQYVKDVLSDASYRPRH